MGFSRGWAPLDSNRADETPTYPLVPSSHDLPYPGILICSEATTTATITSTQL